MREVDDPELRKAIRAQRLIAAASTASSAADRLLQRGQPI